MFLKLSKTAFFFYDAHHSILHDTPAIDGGWSKWSTWSSNTVTCGIGAPLVRKRTCTEPEPAFHGKRCRGRSYDSRSGFIRPCRELLPLLLNIYWYLITQFVLQQSMVNGEPGQIILNVVFHVVKEVSNSDTVHAAVLLLLLEEDSVLENALMLRSVMDPDHAVTNLHLKITM